MTQEQRERHLARRRRNYQLRRQRAANAHLPYTSFPQFQPPESSAGEASTSDELQGLPSPTFAEYGIFPQVIGFPHHHFNLGQQMLNMGTKLLQGDSCFLLFSFQANKFMFHSLFLNNRVIRPLGNFTL